MWSPCKLIESKGKLHSLANSLATQLYLYAGVDGLWAFLLTTIHLYLQHLYWNTSQDYSLITLRGLRHFISIN